MFEIGLYIALAVYSFFVRPRDCFIVEFYVRYADEDSEQSREDVTCDYTFEPCRKPLHILQHDALFEAFDSLPDREREVIRAHLGSCEKCHTTKGRKNRKQIFYENTYPF